MSRSYSVILGNLGNTCDRFCSGYKGWLSMDQYPYREDAAGAIGENIAWLCRYDEILQKHRARIDDLLVTGDAVTTSRFLREALL